MQFCGAFCGSAIDFSVPGFRLRKRPFSGRNRPSVRLLRRHQSAVSGTRGGIQRRFPCHSHARSESFRLRQGAKRIAEVRYTAPFSWYSRNWGQQMHMPSQMATARWPPTSRN